MNHFFLQLCCLLSFLSCQINGQQNPPEKTTNPIPNRQELFQQFRNLSSAVIVYPKEQEAAYGELLKTLERKDKEFEIVAMPADELSIEETKEKIIILFGTPATNPWIAEFAEKLPFEITENALFFDNQQFTDSAIVMRLPLYPNPLNPQIPMQLIAGFSEMAVKEYVENFVEEKERLFIWSPWGYEVFQNQQRVIYGHFNKDDWSYDKKVHFDFTAQPDSMPSTTHFEFYKQTDLNEAQAAVFRKKCEANVVEIRAFLNSQKEIPVVKYCLYGTAEEKGLMIGNTDQSNVQWSKNTVHTVLNDTYGDNFIGKENELLLRQILGEPKTLALERGLAIYFTKKWQRKGYQYWAKKLNDSDNLLPLSDILNEKQGSQSRYLNGCLSASFVEFLIKKNGKETFLKNYLNREFAAAEITKLERNWQDWLATQTVEITNNQSVDIPYLKGFNFAHEGYRIYNGYISREATKSLEKQIDLGANAAAIVPYSFMRNPRKPTTIPVADFAGGENDEAIVHSARMAMNRGMTVVLKPQVWLGGGSWPGDVEMDSEAEWQQWFDNYYEWILHYAMMAEIHEMEVLCVGTEFVKATLNRPEEWRKILKKIRSLYAGKLTYAANWGEEFEQLSFWEDFDYIGLNCYYPLSKNENPSDKELKAGFEKVVEKIEKVYKREQKPIIFTEIGFRSVEMPWLNPHAEPNRPFNAEHQKRCYEVIFEGIYEQPWCQGILWWKFPSYLDHRGKVNTSFSPNDKVVEKVIRKWFGS